MIFSSIRRWRGKRNVPPPDTARLFAQESNDVLMRVGPDLVPTYVSPSAETVLGWPAEAWLDGALRYVYEPDRAQVLAFDQASVANGDERTVTYFRMHHKDGDLRWMEASARHLPSPRGAERGDILLILRDVTERKTREDELAQQARTDGLTGIANRRSFDAALSRNWVNELALNGPISLLMIDIDWFKQFNDRYGHQVGDDCLRAIGTLLRTMFEDSKALPARYGGEEMAVILPDHDEIAACAVAEEVRASVERLGLPHAHNPAGVVTVSIGVATAIAREGGSIRMPEGLVLAADNMLYRAKDNGRNRVESTILLAPERGRIG